MGMTKRIRLFVAVAATLTGLVLPGFGVAPANADVALESSGTTATTQHGGQMASVTANISVTARSGDALATNRAAADEVGVQAVKRGLWPTLPLCVAAGYVGQALDDWDRFVCSPQAFPPGWRLWTNR